MTIARLDLAREQILAFRRRAGGLDERLPLGPDSLRRAAWCGLQDSMPRAALLSINARVAGTGPSAWEDPSLVQLWGPRFSVFVVAARDLAVFSLGLLPDDVKGRDKAADLAARLHAALDGRRVPYEEAGVAVGVPANRLRYAAATGTVLIRWEGARQPTVWTVPPPEGDDRAARLELARRYLHSYGPTTPAGFARWSGMVGDRPALLRRGVPGARRFARARQHAGGRRVAARRRRSRRPRRPRPRRPGAAAAKRRRLLPPAGR
jgi:hypothetical protein